MKIAAYCRVSTEKEEQASSLIHQKEFFIEYARRSGQELFRLYADEGISGTSLKKRDAFNRLMADARSGLFQSVVVKDISRLARNTVDFLVSIRQLKAMGINVIFLNANMDSMGDSEFVLTLFSAMAQEESASLSKRTKFGKRMSAGKGSVPQKLFGYDRIDNFTLAVNPEESATVRKIFTLYNEQGLGCRSISMTLNRDGNKTKFGNDWDARGVRRILGNPIYKGTLVNHKYEIQDFLTGKQVSIPPEERFFHARPEWAIVSEEVFQKAQQILESRRIKYDAGEPFRQGRYSSRHLFSTLIKCAHCSRSFTRKTYTYVNTRVYWKCSTNDRYTARRCDNSVTLNEQELLRALQQYFSSLIVRKEAFVSNVLAALEQKRTCTDDPAQARKNLEARQKKLLSKKSRYQELFANEFITMEELKTKLSGIGKELNALSLALEQCTQADRNDDASRQRSQQYAEEIFRFLELETVSNTDLRRILECICVSRDGCVRIVLKKAEEIRTA